MKVLVFFMMSLIVWGHSSVTLAQTDSANFSIRFFGGEDIDPPTTPTLLSLTPASDTQIDITWSVATDNFTVSGYVLSRDGVPLATTTLTTYSDTGLTASTAYTYTVQAFDASANYSSSSNSLSTTTLDTPPTPTPDPVATSSAGANGTVARVVVRDFTITPGYSTTSLRISTAFPTRFEIRWGRTASYELGYVATEALRSSYYTMLTDLEPGTTYEYEIIGYTPAGIRMVVQRGQFVTLSSFDTISPPNVLRFTAAADRSDVQLSWQMPTGEGIRYVRIVRSHLGFPATPTDGAVMYQGTNESVIDKGVLARYSPAYYTAFVYDSAGNVSSGAVAVVYALRAPVVSDGTITVDDDLIPIRNHPTSSSTMPVDVHMPHSFDILITQGKDVQSFTDGYISLHAELPTLVSIKRDVVSDYLKTIIIRLNDPTDQRITHSLLLRLNKDQTAYEAVIAPLNVAGQSLMFVDVYDLQNFIVANYRTTVTFTVGASARGTGSATLSDITIGLVGVGVIGLLVFILWLFIRRATEDNKR